MIIRPRKSMIQCIGRYGSGGRHFVFDFLQATQKIVWIQSPWSLYAPSLWALAHERQISLVGIDCPLRKKIRELFHALVEENIFDAWVLDHLELHQAEGRFLETLLRRIPSGKEPLIIVLDSKAHSFCRQRFYDTLSHNLFRQTSSRGNKIFKEIPYAP